MIVENLAVGILLLVHICNKVAVNNIIAYFVIGVEREYGIFTVKLHVVFVKLQVSEHGAVFLIVTVKHHIGRSVILRNGAAVVNENGACLVFPVVIGVGQIIDVIIALNNGSIYVAGRDLKEALNIVGDIHKVVHNALGVGLTFFLRGENGNDLAVIKNRSGNSGSYLFLYLLCVLDHFTGLYERADEHYGSCHKNAC